jgi:hypothetical protein
MTTEEPGRGQADAAKELIEGVRPTKVVRALPDLAKVGATAWWRTSRWSISTGLRVGDAVLKGTTAGQPADVILRQASAQAREAVREALGVPDPTDPMPRSLRDRAGTNGAAAPHRPGRDGGAAAGGRRREPTHRRRGRAPRPAAGGPMSKVGTGVSHGNRFGVGTSGVGTRASGPGPGLDWRRARIPVGRRSNDMK